MSNRTRELDGIRGIAILMILVWHCIVCQTRQPEPGTLAAVLRSVPGVFWSGVDLFFLLSGFLVGGLVLDNHAKRGFLKVFWLRRCCRILPVLCVLLGRRVWVHALGPLIVAACALRLAFPGFHAFVNTPFRLDALLCGAGVAVLVRNETVWATVRRRRRPLLGSLCSVLLVTGTVLFANGLLSLALLWFAVFYATLLIFVLLYQGSRHKWLLRTRVLCFWGSISYGLFMFHQGISGLCHGWLRNGAGPSLGNAHGMRGTVLAFLACTAAAWLSRRFYESRFLKIGNRFRYSAGVEHVLVV